MKKDSGFTKTIVIITLAFVVVNSAAIFLVHQVLEEYKETDPIFHATPMHAFLSIIASSAIMILSIALILLFLRKTILKAVDNIKLLEK